MYSNVGTTSYIPWLFINFLELSWIKANEFTDKPFPHEINKVFIITLIMAEPLSAASIFGPGIVHPGSLSRYLHLLGDLNRTEPLLMLLVTPVIFPLWQAKNVCWEKGYVRQTPHHLQSLLPAYFIQNIVIIMLYYFPKSHIYHISPLQLDIKILGGVWP